MDEMKDKPMAGGGEEESPSSCLLLGEEERHAPDLCCCYVIDARGEYDTPCDSPFEERCC